MSLANDARRCCNISTGCMAKNNCRLVLDHQHRVASLQSTEIIPANRKLCWNYRNSYIFPNI